MTLKLIQWLTTSLQGWSFSGGSLDVGSLAIPGRRPGPTVLIVEDDYLIAALIERILLSAGYLVSGPIPRLSEAQGAASLETVDGAILDVNLNGERVYPVAEILTKRNIPYLLITGYSGHHLPTEFAGRPRINKPFTGEELLVALSNLPLEPVTTAAAVT